MTLDNVSQLPEVSVANSPGHITKRITSPATLLTIQISPQWSGTFDASHTMTVDRIRVIEGDLPRFG